MLTGETFLLQEDLYQQACVHSLEEALERCARIGYPIMLKASWGGGGKGIRKVGCGVHSYALGSHATWNALLTLCAQHAADLLQMSPGDFTHQSAQCMSHADWCLHMAQA